MRWLYGATAGLVGALVVALALNVIGICFAGWVEHPLEAYPALALAAMIPGILGGLFLALNVRRGHPLPGMVGPLLVALLGGILATSVGAIFVNWFWHGFYELNYFGYMIWSLPYSFAFLPFSFTASFVVQKVLEWSDA